MNYEGVQPTELQCQANIAREEARRDAHGAYGLLNMLKLACRHVKQDAEAESDTRLARMIEKGLEVQRQVVSDALARLARADRHLRDISLGINPVPR